MTRRVTILGCGSSGGVPRLGGNWGACDPNNPKNRRQRCSILVEQSGPEGTTRVLIDSSPDLRTQLLTAQVGTLDAVVYTHAHADHVHGLDDLRMIVINMRRRLPVWADGPTRSDLLSRFSYAFETPEGSSYPPILEMNDISGPFTITGAGGALDFTPFEVAHGQSPLWDFASAIWCICPMSPTSPKMPGRICKASTFGLSMRCAMIPTPLTPIWKKPCSGLRMCSQNAPY